MWLRRAVFRWLIPAAFVLPAWLLVGWGVFNAGAWAFLWVFFLGIPAVFIGQIVLTLLVRARPTVRSSQAVSWENAAGFLLWHILIVALGFFREAWWASVFILAVIVGCALLWFTLMQLWREAKPGRAFLQAAASAATRSHRPSPMAGGGAEVIVVTETSHHD